MINFNDMPDDIKSLIFGFNRAEQVEIEKTKFKMVMDELKDMTQLTYTDYYDDDDFDIFANALIQAIMEINIEYGIEIYQKNQLDKYLDGCG